MTNTQTRPIGEGETATRSAEAVATSAATKLKELRKKILTTHPGTYDLLMDMEEAGVLKDAADVERFQSVIPEEILKTSLGKDYVDKTKDREKTTPPDRSSAREIADSIEEKYQEVFFQLIDARFRPEFIQEYSDSNIVKKANETLDEYIQRRIQEKYTEIGKKNTAEGANELGLELPEPEVPDDMLFQQFTEAYNKQHADSPIAAQDVGGLIGNQAVAFEEFKTAQEKQTGKNQHGDFWKAIAAAGMEYLKDVIKSSDLMTFLRLIFDTQAYTNYAGKYYSGNTPERAGKREIDRPTFHDLIKFSDAKDPLSRKRKYAQLMRGVLKQLDRVSNGSEVIHAENWADDQEVSNDENFKENLRIFYQKLIDLGQKGKQGLVNQTLAAVQDEPLNGRFKDSYSISQDLVSHFGLLADDKAHFMGTFGR